MNVLSRAERADHVPVARDMREHAQLDLRIVGVDEDMILVRRDEHAAQLSSELGAHRNVLQVRVGRGQAAGRRDHLLKMRVDAVVLRVRNGKQAVHIGALELGQATVFQNVCDDGMVVAQALEHLCTRRIAGLGLFRSRQSEPLE